MAPQLRPVWVQARLDTPLSRWLWLVKWLLAVPHFLILALLWLAFVVLTVVAFVAILVTGRYPRAIFDFNVGVLRWNWRVHYYAYSALGTDRYPPFTLADVPDYPARLRIDYPPRLHRGLVLVKWLLAVPHYLVIGLFLGGGAWLVRRWGDGGPGWGGVGLIGILVFVAAIVLLFTGTYPKPVFDFVLGMNRWVLRVAAYVGLLTDEYPPFRLDMGGTEPDEGLVPEDTEPTEPTEGGRRPGGWTVGRIVSVVVGALFALGALGLLAAGSLALWADRTQRDDDGYVTAEATLRTDTFALSSEPLSLGPGAADWVTSELGDVRVRVTPTVPGVRVFLGMTSAEEAEQYLRGTGHAVVSDITGRDVTTLQFRSGTPPAPPDSVDIWAATASGTRAVTLDTPVSEGEWVLVVLNADRHPGVSVRAEVGATAPALPWVAGTALAGGAVALVVGALLIGIAARRATG